MGTPSDASGTDFRIGERKATTDCTEGARCTEQMNTEEKQPPDAERELPGPAQTPETREAASTETRDTTVYESRHDPEGSWLYKVRSFLGQKNNRGTGEGNRGGGPGEREHRGNTGEHLGGTALNEKRTERFKSTRVPHPHS
ncbi:hypothetical protein NDU88_003730 [Pleurodeles waltl]|uniref:Uncharacterized protein n=1 Tax=Pleurodeles waltl TaxID=8319 RepID=A0AAV7MBX7_PLEWA|nr:hypothetical protein NDU88_003730 [Pleurodeles waltl]